MHWTQFSEYWTHDTDYMMAVLEDGQATSLTTQPPRLELLQCYSVSKYRTKRLGLGHIHDYLCWINIPMTLKWTFGL